MIVLAQIVLRLLADMAGLIALSLRRQRSVEAENLFLRRQLALYQERGIKARRVDAVTRVSLALLSRLFDWRDALVVARPETLIRWHRAGWRLFWRVKSRPGRPPIPLELRQLIRRMASENPIWGEERIANELLLKLGLRVSPRTVRKYLPKRPRRGAQEAISVGRPSCAITRARSSPVTSSWRSRRHSGCSTCSWSLSTAAADFYASP